MTQTEPSVIYTQIIKLLFDEHQEEVGIVSLAEILGCESTAANIIAVLCPARTDERDLISRLDELLVSYKAAINCGEQVSGLSFK